MPQGVTPDAGMLRGLAVVVEDGGPHLQALPLESLPPTAALRFRAARGTRTWPRPRYGVPQCLPTTRHSASPRLAEALFKVKPAWRLAELEPFLEGIVGPDQKGEAVVLQHARCVTASDGSRSYVARV